MAKVDLLNNVLASGDKALWQKTAQSKKALVEAARGDRDISTLRPVLSVQKPSTTSASDTSWMQNIFTTPGQSRGRTAPSAPAVAPIQTPELDASVGNTPGTGTMSTDYLSFTGQDFGQATDKAPPAAQTPILAAWLKNRFSQGVAENRLGQEGAAAEMAGQSEGPAASGDPEDVARQEWARYGVDNARDYNAAVDYEQRYVGRRAAQGAMDSVRNTANDVGYRAQAGAGRAAAEDAYWADVMTGTVPAEDYSKYQQVEQDNTVTELKQVSHLGEAYAQKTAELFPEVTAEMQQLGDLAAGITGMAPQIVMGAASLALGNAAPALSALLKVTGSAALFSSASGGAAKDALLNGAKPEDALRYGTVVGMVELATEKIANGLGLFGKAAGLGGVTDDLVEGIIKKYVNDTAAQKAFLYVAGMLGEGFEEWVSEYADYFANKKMPGIGYDTRTIQEVGADARYSFAIGSLISAVMQTSNVLQGRRNVTAEDVKAELDNAVRAQEAATGEVTGQETQTQTETGTPAAQPAAALSFESMSRAQAQTAVEQILTRGISGLEAFQIINSPVAKSAFESLTGRVLAGTNLEQVTVITEVSRDMRQAASRSAIFEAERNYPKSTLGAATTVTSAQPPVTAQEAPGDALAPGAVVTAPTDPNAPTQVLNPGAGETSAAPAVAPNVTAETPAATVPNSAPANPAVQSAAPGSFDEMLQQSPGVHPVNAEGAANAQLYQNRDVTQVPTQNFQGHLTSKTASTIMNAGITPTELVTQMQEAMARGAFSRIAYTDAAAQANAEAHIADVGWDVALAEYKADTRAGKSSKDITTLGTVLYNNALTNGDMLTAMDIVSQMIQNRKATAQSLQATNMLNKATPDGRLYMAMRGIDNIREQLIQKYGDKAPDLQIDDALMQEYYDALKSGDKNAQDGAWLNIMKDVAGQIDATWYEKLDAWRYLSMLGNVKTNVRNIVGNIVFLPMRLIKNIMATSLEIATDAANKALGKGGIDRTKAFLNPFSAKDRALVISAWGDYQNVVNEIQSGGKYNDRYGVIENYRTIFRKLKGIEWFRKASSKALDVGDIIFSQPAYTSALAGYLKANGFTAVDFSNGTMTAEDVAKARKYAVKEAQRATYRQASALADKLNSFRYHPKADDSLGEKILGHVGNTAQAALMPFVKTVVNVAKTGIYEYDAPGLIVGIGKVINSVAGGKVTAADAIDQLSAGLTGVGIMWLGSFLYSIGALTAGPDDDEKQDEFSKLQGYQNYSLVAGGKSIPIDQLAPFCLPLFVGAELRKAFSDKPGLTWAEAGEAALNITDPILEMSFMSGVQEAIRSARSVQDGREIGAIAAHLTWGYLSQFFPTLGGQVERAFTENQREETFRYGESNVLGSSGQYELGELLNKVPGVDYNQIPYVNAWGERTDSGNLFDRIVTNFANPFYVNDITNTQRDAELQRLYDLGFNTVLPSRAAQSKQIRLYDSDGNVTEKTHMTADEYVAYNEKAGKLAQSYIGSLVLSDFYKGLSDDEKADMIERVYDYANQIATREMAQGRGANYPVDTWVSNAMRSENPMHYIEMYAMYGDAIYSDRYAALVQGGMTEEEAGSLYHAMSDALDGSTSISGIFAAATSQNLSDDKTDAALRAYLEESAYARYSAARDAGITPQSYANYYARQSSFGSSQADVFAAMNQTDWTPGQRAAVWDTYGWKTDYDTYAASH